MQNEIFSVKNKKILVTGATTGLGKHFACILAKAGASIIACGRKSNLLNELESEIKKDNGKINTFEFDLTNFDESEIILDKILKKFEGIDVIINNAGFSPKIKKQIFDIKLSDWDEILNINLKAIWHLSNIIAKDMVSRNISGSIINISSTVANRSRIGNPIYGISKSAVSSLTQKLSLEYSKYNIRVNAIAPGFFETDMNREYVLSPQGQETIKRTVPLGRTGNKNELNGAIFLLASNASSYITGECIYIDGGYIVNSIT